MLLTDKECSCCLSVEQEAGGVHLSTVSNEGVFVELTTNKTNEKSGQLEKAYLFRVTEILLGGSLY